jgi:hypothetical protein
LAPVRTRGPGPIWLISGRQFTIIVGCWASSTNGVPSPYCSITLPALIRRKAKLRAKTSGLPAYGASSL